MALGFEIFPKLNRFPSALAGGNSKPANLKPSVVKFANIWIVNPMVPVGKVCFWLVDREFFVHSSCL